MNDANDPKTAEQGPLRVLITEESERRQLVAGALIPDQPPLSPEQREAVGAALTGYLELHKLEFRDVARGMGGNVCEYALREVARAGGDDDELRIKVNSWLEQDARRRGSAPGRTALVMTEPAKQLMNAARLAQYEETLVLVIGPTGVGKTTVAEVIVDRTVGAIYARAGHYCKSAAGLRNRLAELLNCNKRVRIAKDPRHVVDRIFDKLRESHRLLVVDQAHELTDDGLRFLFELKDRTGIGVLCLCTCDLWHRIQAEADEDHGQLFSRVGAVIEIGEMKGDGRGMGQPLFTRSEIVQLYQTPKVRLTDDAVGYLFVVANTLGKGSLRRCGELVSRAVRRATNEAGGAESVTITAELLESTERRYMRSESGRQQLAPRGAMAATA